MTSTEFRRNASAILDEVERGERVQISRHGRVVAEMIPASGHGAQPSWKRPGPRLTMRGGSLTAAILDERRQRR